MTFNAPASWPTNQLSASCLQRRAAQTWTRWLRRCAAAAQRLLERLRASAAPIAPRRASDNKKPSGLRWRRQKVALRRRRPDSENGAAGDSERWFGARNRRAKLTAWRRLRLFVCFAAPLPRRRRTRPTNCNRRTKRRFGYGAGGGTTTTTTITTCAKRRAAARVLHGRNRAKTYANNEAARRRRRSARLVPQSGRATNIPQSAWRPNDDELIKQRIGAAATKRNFGAQITN